MLCLATGRRHKEDLDDLTENQLADIDRLLMILYRTRPAICSTDRSTLKEGQHVLRLEESSEFHFLRVSGL